MRAPSYSLHLFQNPHMLEASRPRSSRPHTGRRGRLPQTIRSCHPCSLRFLRSGQQWAGRGGGERDWVRRSGGLRKWRDTVFFLWRPPRSTLCSSAVAIRYVRFKNPSPFLPQPEAEHQKVGVAPFYLLPASSPPRAHIPSRVFRSKTKHMKKESSASDERKAEKTSLFLPSFIEFINYLIYSFFKFRRGKHIQLSLFYMHLFNLLKTVFVFFSFVINY